MYSIHEVTSEAHLEARKRLAEELGLVFPPVAAPGEDSMRVALMAIDLIPRIQNIHQSRGGKVSIIKSYGIQSSYDLAAVLVGASPSRVSRMMYIYHHDRGTYDRLVRGEYRMFDEEFRAVQVLVSSRVGRQGKSPGEGGGSGKDPQETQQAWLSELRKKAGVDPAKHVNKSRSSLYLAALNMHPRLRLIAKREKRFSASRMGYNSYLELGLALMGGPKKNYLKREEFLYHNDRAAFDRVMKGVSSVEQEYLSCKREMARNKNPGGTEQPAAPRQDRVSPRRDGSRGMDQALLFNMELESKANSLVKRVDWDMVLCSCSTAELASMEKTNRAIVGMVRKVGRILRASLKERAEQQQQQQQQQ